MTILFLLKALTGMLTLKGWCAAFLFGSIGISGGASGSYSKSGTQAGPKWMSKIIGKGMALPLMDRLLQGYDPNGPLARGSQIVTGKTLAGDYMSPESNPYLSETADAIGRRGMETFANMDASIRRASQGTGSLLSSKTGQASSAAGRSVTQDVLDKLTSLFGTNYATERRYQNDAVPTATNLNQLPLNTLLDLINVQLGRKSTTTSHGVNWQGSGSASYGAGGAPGAGGT